MIFRFDSPLIYLNARRFSTKLREGVEDRPGLNLVLFDCSAVYDIDITAAGAFTETLRQLDESGVELWVSSVRDRTWTRMVSALDATGLAHPRRFASNEAAVQEALGKNDV